jgi:hypothetical protein
MAAECLYLISKEQLLAFRTFRKQTDRFCESILPLSRLAATQWKVYFGTFTPGLVPFIRLPKVPEYLDEGSAENQQTDGGFEPSKLILTCKSTGEVKRVIGL